MSSFVRAWWLIFARAVHYWSVLGGRTGDARGNPWDHRRRSPAPDASGGVGSWAAVATARSARRADNNGGGSDVDNYSGARAKVPRFPLYVGRAPRRFQCWRSVQRTTTRRWRPHGHSSVQCVCVCIFYIFVACAASHCNRLPLATGYRLPL